MAINHIIIACLTKDEEEIYQRFYETFVTAFSKKLQDKSPESKIAIIKFDPISGFTEQQVAILQSTQRITTELHIMGHCSEGLDHLSTLGSSADVQHDKFAYNIERATGQHKKIAPLTISLIACSAAKKSENQESFAKRFHLSLKTYGIYSILKARTKDVLVSSHHHKQTVLPGFEDIAREIFNSRKSIVATQNTIIKICHLKERLTSLEKSRLIELSLIDIYTTLLQSHKRNLLNLEHQNKLENEMLAIGIDQPDILRRLSSNDKELKETNKEIESTINNLNTMQSELAITEKEIIHIKFELSDFAFKTPGDIIELPIDKLKDAITECTERYKKYLSLIERCVGKHQENSKVILFFNGKGKQEELVHDYHNKQNTPEFLIQKGCYQVPKHSKSTVSQLFNLFSTISSGFESFKQAPSIFPALTQNKKL